MVKVDGKRQVDVDKQRQVGKRLQCVGRRRRHEVCGGLYVVGKMLGSGTDGSVYEVKKRDGGSYAMKVMDVGKVDMYYVRGLPLEAYVMIDLDGVEGVCRMDRVWHSRPYGEIEEAYCMVMEMPVGGSYCALYEMEYCYRSHLRVVFSRLCKVLERVNEKNISHMDLHGGNVLVVRKSLRVTLIDFGRAQYKSVVPYEHAESYRKWIGSPPELRQDGLFDYDRQTVWTFGRMLFESLDGGRGSRLCEDFLGRVLVRDYRRRMTLDEMFKHPYMDLCVDDDYSECGGDKWQR